MRTGTLVISETGTAASPSIVNCGTAAALASSSRWAKGLRRSGHRQHRADFYHCERRKRQFFLLTNASKKRFGSVDKRRLAARGLIRWKGLENASGALIRRLLNAMRKGRKILLVKRKRKRAAGSSDRPFHPFARKCKRHRRRSSECHPHDFQAKLPAARVLAKRSSSSSSYSDRVFGNSDLPTSPGGPTAWASH